MNNIDERGTTSEERKTKNEERTPAMTNAHPSSFIVHRSSSPRVLVLGAGFGGLYAARALRKAHVGITVVDRRNYHLFQPLLYQVATAALNPSDIAAPIRSILRRQKNVSVMLGEAVRIDAEKRVVVLQD